MRKSSALWIGIQLYTLAGALGIMALADNRGLWVLSAYALSALVGATYVVRRVEPISVSMWFSIAYFALFYLGTIVYYLVRAISGFELFVFNKETFLIYNMMAIAGVHLFYIGREISIAREKRKLPRAQLRFVFSSSRFDLVVYALSLLLLFATALVIVDAGSISAALSATRGEQILSRSPLSLLSTYLFLFALPLYVLLPSYLKRRPLAIPFFIAVLPAIEALYFILFRSRSFFISHMIAFISGWYFHRQYVFVSAKTRRPWIQKLISTKRRMAMVTIGMILALAIGITARMTRGYIGADGPLVEFSQATLQSYLIESIVRGDMGYAPIVMRLIEFVPQTYDYLYGQSYWRLLLVPIPRAIFPEKPPNTQRVVGQWIEPGTEVLSIAPGIIGDLYINFGMFGILSMLIYGLVFGRIEKIRGTSGMIFASISFMPVFHLVRGAFTNPVMIGLSIYIGCKIIASSIQSRAELEMEEQRLWSNS